MCSTDRHRYFNAGPVACSALFSVVLSCAFIRQKTFVHTTPEPWKTHSCKNLIADFHADEFSENNLTLRILQSVLIKNAECNGLQCSELAESAAMDCMWRGNSINLGISGNVSFLTLI